ncbi:MAG: tyrosine-type recombinase/integrase [Pseudomonadota bacterium]|nr:tyrosine-type recombinase/integrase [Pseudomonadota bacterium]
MKRYVQDPATLAPLHDGGGLYLRKRDTVALWYLRLTEPATGQEQWHRMFPDDPAGGYPDRSLLDARAEAKRLWGLRSQGTDPRAQRLEIIASKRAADLEAVAAKKRKVTVRALFDRWRAVDLQPRVGADGKRIGRKDGGEYVCAQFERRVFPKIGHLAAEQIKRGDLLELLDGVKTEGKLRTANMLLTDLKQMFRFALARDLVFRNPLDTVSKRDVGGASVQRDRVLTSEEIRQLSSSIEASGLRDRFSIGIWLILATGVRIGELVGAVWFDEDRDQSHLKAIADEREVKLGFVNLMRRTWYLPETKNQRDHTIHLSAFAITQFEKLAQLAVVSDDDPRQPLPWVFPNMTDDGPVGVKAFGKQLSDRQRTPERRLAHRSKATTSMLLSRGRWTAHDLRRTAATRMAEIGISGDVIDECLNHMIESRVRRTYIRDRRLSAQRRAFEALGARLQLLVAGPAPAKRPLVRPVRRPQSTSARRTNSPRPRFALDALTVATPITDQ